MSAPSLVNTYPVLREVRLLKGKQTQNLVVAIIKESDINLEWRYDINSLRSCVVTKTNDALSASFRWGF